MKTIKNLLKELLYAHRAQQQAETPEASVSDENQSNQSPLNSNQNETETNETAGNPELDNSSAGENPGNDKGNEGEADGDAGNFRPTGQLTEDGIPRFRGRPAPRSLSGDIFSMAREA